MSKLPPFDRNGLLPPGDYEMTLDELDGSHLVTGLTSESTWARKWRRHLVRNVRILAEQLWQVGIRNIFVDGSFVEDKIKPNDIDGYFECNVMDLATGDLQHALNALDPYKVWTWDPNSRRPDSSSTKQQLPMWHRYRVELYPHAAARMTSSGLRDEYGNELQFPAAFRRQRDSGLPKGIIKLVRENTND